MKPRTVLITGAAGTVGLETVRELCKSSCNYNVRTFDLPSRYNRRRLSKFGKAIERSFGSIDDKNVIKNALEGVDAVIHLAAVVPPLADDNPKITGKVNVWGTHVLLEAMKRQTPEALLVYASSDSVYGDRLGNPWISVNDTLNPSHGDHYAGSKITAEGMITNSGLDYSIFRLSNVMGPYQVRRRVLDPMMFCIPLDTRMEIISSRDAGRAFARSIDHSDAIRNRIFNVGGGDTCRVVYRDLLKRVFALWGLEFETLNQKAFATRNFHSGLFVDSEVLHNIVDFQRDSIDSLLSWMESSYPRHLYTALGQARAVARLLRTSAPLRALEAGNSVLIDRFFGNSVVPGR